VQSQVLKNAEHEPTLPAKRTAKLLDATDTIAHTKKNADRQTIKHTQTRTHTHARTVELFDVLLQRLHRVKGVVCCVGQGRVL